MSFSERLLKDNTDSRLNMIHGQLRPNGVGDQWLIEAFGTIPREAFVSPALKSIAYGDGDIPLVPGRWLLAPLTLAKLFQMADIQPTDKMLVVGCGSGYSLALASRLAASVVGLENHEALTEMARAYQKNEGIPNVQVVQGALASGYPEEAPYDVILIEGAVEKIPPLFGQQLSPRNGRLVTIRKGKGEMGKGVLMTRADDRLTERVKFDASCPYLPEFEAEEAFKL